MQRIIFILIVTSCFFAVPANADKVVYEDSFEAATLDEGWEWLRPQHESWCLRDKALEIRVQPGKRDTVKNALMRKAPDRSQGSYAIEVTITNHSVPTNQYEQAGITLYSKGKPVFKLVRELVDGKQLIIPGRKPMDSPTVQLRLIVSANSWIAQYRAGGEDKYQTAASGKLPPPDNDQISLQCYDGPADAEHWIRFDDFRIVKLED